MKINLRQGIVRYQKDTQNNQQFLLETSTGIDLITTNDPTIVSFAHKNRNYLYTEKRSVRNAWIGPFESNKDYWLYWDLDVKTGVRTFGHTTIPPIVDSNAPKNPPIDQHWFDTETDMMMVYNGATFKERIRVFAAKYTDGTVIDSYFGNSLFGGSQIGVNSVVSYYPYAQLKILAITTRSGVWFSSPETQQLLRSIIGAVTNRPHPP